MSTPKMTFGPPSLQLLLLLAACWTASPCTGLALAPRRLRLSRGPSDSSPLTITWATEGGLLPAAVCVEWEAALPAAGRGLDQPRLGPGPAPQQRCASGASTPFHDPGVNATTQVVHSMELRGVDLPPGHPFRYRVATVDAAAAVVVAAAAVWSPWQAAHVPGSNDEETRLLVLGDMGLYNAPALPALIQDAESAAQAGAPFHAALHVGDLAYDLHSYGGSRGSRFLEAVQPLAASLPYMVAPGNHEAGPHNFTHYRSLFRMPDQGVTENLYYSFDVGLVHVMVYNTEVFFWPDYFWEPHMEAMLAWMEADLQAAQAQRAKHPWILAVGHRPMYCAAPLGSTGRCHEESEASRNGVPSQCPHNNPLACKPEPGRRAFPVEPLFQAYGVDLAVYGHIHDYERYLPVLNYTVSGSVERRADNATVYVSPGATVHITAGGAGNSEMRKGECPPPQGACSPHATWCAFQSGFAPRGCQGADHSYGRLTALNSTHLHWVQWSHTFDRVVDDWWIVSPSHGPFA
uniref:Purple acid phosphatase n=1 Tax=Auxenochlorella protothecoides TaxID=3075 RepID=A0A1D1ZZT9_AUXPR